MGRTVLILLVSVFIFCIGCKGKIEEDAVTERKLPEKVLIKFYTETSSSMTGFLNQNTEFKNNITGLVSKLDKLSGESSGRYSMSFFLIPDDTSFTMFTDNPRDYIRDVSSASLMTGNSSRLDKILDNIINRLDSGEVAFFISDFIISYESSEIRKNKEINRENLSALKNYMTLVFNSARKKGLALSVYSLKSGFFGNYYDYQNNIKVLEGTLMPYYIFVTGHPDNLAEINSFLGANGFEYDDQLQFGYAAGIPIHKILTYSMIEGRLYKGDKFNEVKNESAKDEEVQFTVALDLSAYPPYYLENDYLERNLMIKSGDAVIKSKVIYSADEFKDKIHSRETEELKNFTHFVVLRVSKTSFSINRIGFELKDSLPDWYKGQSTIDDKTDFAGKTFALEEMIEGIKSSYHCNEQKLFEFSIYVKNE